VVVVDDFDGDGDVELVASESVLAGALTGTGLLLGITDPGD
jgi:hypothetical protein